LSGFVALFQRNGAPLDPGLLQHLTASLSFRGPDGCDTWRSETVGLGHALLQIARTPPKSRQPATLDGRWITGDIRLDRRNELRAELSRAGREVEASASDAQLVLHAYAIWNDDCVKRLFGDFSFAIWDERQQRLFCARDHFGTRPFYYAVTSEFFLCSNTLECTRQHPAVSDELNDQAVADFLLFGLNCDRATTTFRDVQRLTAAHFLSVSAGHFRIQRYWSLPTDGRIRYKRNEDYVCDFLEKFRAAMLDRMTDLDRAGIFLSGGMDSGSIAAVATEIARDSGTKLKGYTATYERLLGDREGYFAQQTADFLKIPVEVTSFDHLKPFEGWEDDRYAFPEPVDDPVAHCTYEQFAAVAKDSRVVFYGEGIDNLMYFQLTPYLKDLARRGEWLTLLGAFGGFLWKQRSRWHRVPHRIVRRFTPKSREPKLPAWLAPDLAACLDLKERLKCFDVPALSPGHPVLPIAHASFEIPHWALLFETCDAGATRQPVEMRHPFLDLRIVEYLLSLPPFPLFLHKKIERDAMIGKLPEPILKRPKTPLGRSPGLVALKKASLTSLQHIRWSDDIARYVSRELLLKGAEMQYSDNENSCIRPVCFNFWLKSSRRVRYKLSLEVRNA
jgi:asparagine synthase (glutamine-hydrolysing)